MRTEDYWGHNTGKVEKELQVSLSNASLETWYERPSVGETSGP